MTILDIFEMLGIDERGDPWAWIDQMIDNSTLEEDIKEECHQFNNPNTAPEVYEIMIRMLYDSRIDPVTQGRAYNQTDIKRHLNRICDD